MPGQGFVYPAAVRQQCYWRQYAAQPIWRFPSNWTAEEAETLLTWRGWARQSGRAAKQIAGVGPPHRVRIGQIGKEMPYICVPYWAFPLRGGQEVDHNSGFRQCGVTPDSSAQPLLCALVEKDVLALRSSEFRF